MTPSKINIVHDFFDTKIKDHSKKIIVMGTKINTDMTLRMIKINQILTIDSITKKILSKTSSFIMKKNG
jgi:hypothetical protein